MRRIATIVIAGAFVLAACGSASEVLTEQIVEQIDGVDNVEVDTDTGQMNVETDEGSFSIGGGEVPDDFPVPLPDGYSVQSVFTSDSDSSVSVSYPRDRYDELISYFGDWTASEGGDWSNSTSSFNQGDGQTMRSSTWSMDDQHVSVSDCFDMNADGDEFNAACVTIITSGG